MSDLDRERDAIIRICAEAAGTQERMLGMFPQNTQYKEFAQMARWVAAEVEKRKGIVFGEDGSEVQGAPLAAICMELRCCQEEIVELKGLIGGLRVERDRLKSLVLAHEENTARIMTSHKKSIDEHAKKDGLIHQLTGDHEIIKAKLEEGTAAMGAERTAIRTHERLLIAGMVRKMADRSPDPVEDKILKTAASAIESGVQ
jgi:hypothetical protein